MGMPSEKRQSGIRRDPPPAQSLGDERAAMAAFGCARTSRLSAGPASSRERGSSGFKAEAGRYILVHRTLPVHGRTRERCLMRKLKRARKARSGFLQSDLAEGARAGPTTSRRVWTTSNRLSEVSSTCIRSISARPNPDYTGSATVPGAVGSPGGAHDRQQRIVRDHSAAC